MDDLQYSSLEKGIVVHICSGLLFNRQSEFYFHICCRPAILCEKYQPALSPFLLSFLEAFEQNNMVIPTFLFDDPARNEHNTVGGVSEHTRTPNVAAISKFAHFRVSFHAENFVAFTPAQTFAYSLGMKKLAVFLLRTITAVKKFAISC